VTVRPRSACAQRESGCAAVHLVPIKRAADRTAPAPTSFQTYPTSSTLSEGKRGQTSWPSASPGQRAGGSLVAMPSVDAVSMVPWQRRVSLQLGVASLRVRRCRQSRPSNISAAPRGLVRFPVTSTKRTGSGDCVLNVYANASRPFSASEQIAMFGFGINTPDDNRQIVSHPDGGVIERPRWVGCSARLSWPVESKPLTHDDGIPVGEADVKSSASPAWPTGF
jgi:hypothetical protein